MEIRDMLLTDESISAIFGKAVNVALIGDKSYSLTFYALIVCALQNPKILLDILDSSRIYNISQNKYDLLIVHSKIGAIDFFDSYPGWKKILKKDGYLLEFVETNSLKKLKFASRGLNNLMPIKKVDVDEQNFYLLYRKNE